MRDTCRVYISYKLEDHVTINSVVVAYFMAELVKPGDSDI